MDGMVMGTPWLDKPMALHAYREYECSLNDTALCDYQQGYWRFWYQADYRFALPTVAFFLVTIVLFAMTRFFDMVAPASLKSTSIVRRITALGRFLSYRVFRIPILNWNSAPLGILALSAVGTIYFICMTLAPKPYYWPNTEDVDFGSSPPLATRSGWLSLACLPFVFATAGKSNLITAVTGVSHERLQVFHRWISYAFFVTALMHTFPFIVYDIETGTMVSSWKTSVFYWTGVIALIAQTYLTFASISPLRSISYEWFKFSHFVAALVFVLFLFFHCDHTLSAWDYFIATGVLFSLSWLHRQIRIYFEHGIGHKASIHLTANGFICVRIPTKAHWEVGQHFFVRFLAFGLHIGSLHPFTACSLPTEGSSFDDRSSELVLYIRPQGGLTARLAQLAQCQANAMVRVLLDGPYGGINPQKLASSQRQLIVAGGSGAGWLFAMITAFLRQAEAQAPRQSNDHHPRSARIILSTRDSNTKAWFDETIRELLEAFHLEELPSSLEIELHHTGPSGEDAASVPRQEFEKLHEHEITSNPKESGRVRSSSSSELGKTQTLKHFSTRPDLPALIRSEMASPALQGHLGVFVCGPLGMQHDVANAVAQEQLAVVKGGSGEVYLHMEHFSWA